MTSSWLLTLQFLTEDILTSVDNLLVRKVTIFSCTKLQNDNRIIGIIQDLHLITLNAVCVGGWGDAKHTK